MFLKPNFLLIATASVLIIWFGLDFLYISPSKLEIQNIIQQRIKRSAEIANQKIIDGNYPHVQNFLSDNIVDGSILESDKLDALAADFFNRISEKSGTKLESIQLEDSHLDLLKKTAYYSLNFYPTSMENIEVLLNHLAQDLKINNLEELIIRYSKTQGRKNYFQLQLKISLPYYLNNFGYELSAL